jgi:hypothetical protein
MAVYCSRTSQVPFTCSFEEGDDEARSSIVCLRLLYLIMVCLFRWLDGSDALTDDRLAQGRSMRRRYVQVSPQRSPCVEEVPYFL